MKFPNASRAARTGMIPLLLFIAACAWFPHPAPAQDRPTDWTLTTADLTSRPITWSAINARGIQTPKGEVPWSRFVEMSQAAAPSPATQPSTWQLNLSGDDTLPGRPDGISGENLSWQSPLLGKITVPLNRITGMDALAASPPAPQTSRPMEDQASLSNGDLVKGILVNLTDQTLSMQVNAQTAHIPLNGVEHLRLAAAGAAQLPTGRSFRIHLDDGSILTVASVESRASRLLVTLADGSHHEMDLSHLIGLEQINGPILWLPSLTPVQSIQTPQFDLSWPARMNLSVTGQPIRFDQTLYRHGIGVHAYSRLTFSLPDGYNTFRTQYAIDGLGQYADVTVRIYLDNRQIYERADVRAGELAPVITFPLKNAKTLALEVDFGKNGGVQDRFNWIEPALLRAAPTPQPPTTAQ